MLSTLLISALLATPAPSARPPAGPVAAPPARVAADEPEVSAVRFETSDNKVLFGDFDSPRRPQERATAVLLVHGAGESRAEYEGLAASLAKRNFAVFRFDLRGHGESATEELDWSGLDEEQRLEAWTFTPRDLKAAAAWLLAEDGVHSSALHVIAAGEGAALAARHATKDRQVQSLTLIEPLVDPLGFEFEEDLAELEGLPLLINVPKQQRKELDALLEAAEMTDAVEIHASKADPETLALDARCQKAIGTFIESTLEPELRGTRRP